VHRAAAQRIRHLCHVVLAQHDAHALLFYPSSALQQRRAAVQAPVAVTAVLCKGGGVLAWGKGITECRKSCGARPIDRFQRLMPRLLLLFLLFPAVPRRVG
jgi:hypothetical protein